MRFFSRKQAENERNQDNSRTNEVQSTTKEVHSRSNEEEMRFNEGQTTKKEISSRSNRGELYCEEAIMKDKERFGRVRKSLMDYLRETHGEQIANRALWRVNKRITEGYLNP
ncbi:MAG: hypothetical protein ACREA7_09440 [Nitrosotalea sp.]